MKITFFLIAIIMIISDVPAYATDFEGSRMNSDLLIDDSAYRQIQKPLQVSEGNQVSTKPHYENPKPLRRRPASNRRMRTAPIPTPLFAPVGSNGEIVKPVTVYPSNSNNKDVDINAIENRRIPRESGAR